MGRSTPGDASRSAGRFLTLSDKEYSGCADAGAPAFISNKDGRQTGGVEHSVARSNPGPMGGMVVMR